MKAHLTCNILGIKVLMYCSTYCNSTSCKQQYLLYITNLLLICRRLRTRNEAPDEVRRLMKRNFEETHLTDSDIENDELFESSGNLQAGRGRREVPSGQEGAADEGLHRCGDEEFWWGQSGRVAG